MSAIPGTRRQFRELVDGTIRVMIDIDPPYRKRFLDTFGEIDMPVAIVPMERAAKLLQPEPETEPQLKGGELSKLAGRWCHREDFQQWLPAAFPKETRAAPDSETAEGYAAYMVRTICGVNSRALLDHNPGAKWIFEEKIRKPFLAHIGAVA